MKERLVPNHHESDYHRRYEQFKKGGKLFFPDVIFEDAVVSLLVMAILIGLTLVLGVPTEDRADPTNTSYIPRPEWYFLFLFQSLKLFPGQLEWVGVVVVPAVLVMVLLTLPFYDRNPKRSPRRRPLAMVLVIALMLALVGLTVASILSTPPQPAQAAATGRLTLIQLEGKRLYGANCAACHSIAGVGGNVGPDLAGIGQRRNATDIHTYIEEPSDLNPSTKMPSFVPQFTHQEIENITQYLLAAVS
ncbi:MAG: c-type cytochrome [Chloroflexi bacterium]|nr:c-type cytochrome [Chloroflexota bacterium]